MLLNYYNTCAMLLNIVKAKTEQGKDVNFEVNFAPDNKLFEDKNFKFLTPITVKGVQNYSNEELSINAVVSFKILTICDNCGEEFEKDISFNLSEKFLEQYNSHSEEDYLINQMCVEIDKPVIDALLLNMPTKMLCKDDCKGLCPICGKNKNFSTCNCEELVDELDKLDNPFNQLKK